MEQLDVLLQKLGAALLWQKLAGLAVLVLLILGGYYYIFLSDVLDERARMEAEITQLTKEKGEYEERKREYLSYKREIAQLQEEQKDVLRYLPKTDDIEQFVEAIQQQVELAGLNKISLIRDPPVPQELFIRLPVKMTVYGSYFQVLRFLKSMGEVPRIVNIEDLQLTPMPIGANKDELKADFIAVAFQYLDRNAKGAVARAPGSTMKPVATSAGGK